MKLWVRLTLDGMARALRAKAHELAERLETEGRAPARDGSGAQTPMEDDDARRP